MSTLIRRLVETDRERPREDRTMLHGMTTIRYRGTINRRWAPDDQHVLDMLAPGEPSSTERSLA